VPDRDGPPFPGAESISVAGPDPELALTDTQSVALPTDQPHPAEVSMATPTLPPPLENEALDGETVYAHATVAAACETLTLYPATLRDPERAPPAFAGADSEIVAGPVPEVALVVTQPVLLLTDHEQVEPVVIETFTVPPLLVNEAEVGDTP
jgi:hypothetical protein